MSTDVKVHLTSAANELRAAEKHQLPLEPLTRAYPNLSREEAHWIQSHNIEARIAEGERLTGYKLGLTSREAQKQFQVFQPDYGRLTNRMAVWDEGEIALEELIQPRIEGEIALVLGKDLAGPGLTVTDAIRAVDFATASLEIVDCRMRDWKVAAIDLVADNGASSRYVLAPQARSVRDLNLSDLGMALSQNGEVRCTGSGAATLGSPFHALTFLANELGTKGLTLKAGQVVLTGALSAMLKVLPNEVYTCEIQRLGKVSVRFASKRDA